MANRIGAHMEGYGVKFVKDSVPSKLEKSDDGKIKVEY